jgi:hypothetical protein
MLDGIVLPLAVERIDVAVGMVAVSILESHSLAEDSWAVVAGRPAGWCRCCDEIDLYP